MSRILKTRRAKVLGVAMAAMAIAAVAAFAYWTTSGSGSGTATAGSANGTLTLHASGWAGITPGGSKTVSFTADNLGTSDLRLGTISGTVTTSDPACKATDFSMPDVVANQTIPAGSSALAVTQTGTLSFQNDAVNSQDACKGATITITLTSN